jgi:hypothetical protein
MQVGDKQGSQMQLLFLPFRGSSVKKSTGSASDFLQAFASQTRQK